MQITVDVSKIFVENEAAQQSVTMQKRFSTTMATIWYKASDKIFVL